jgi:hypothetical protein
VDTFTVFYPSAYHTYPVAGFNMDILHAVEEQVASDLYVDPQGSDENSGLSAEQPLKTIEQAIRKLIADSLNPRNVFLSPGVYGPSTTGESFPVKCRSYVSLHGEDAANTILDAEQSGGILKAYRNKEVVIDNICMRNGSYSVGITACENILFHRIGITDHTRHRVSWGPALQIDASSNVNLINLTIAGNKAFDYHGNPSPGSAIRSNSSGVKIANSVIWFNGEDPLMLIALTHPYGGYLNKLSMTYSNNQFADSCFTQPFMGYFYWLNGNLDTNPMFRDTTNHDYRLLRSSPCIDAGIQDAIIIYNDGRDTIYVPAMAYLGDAPDMGAFEFDPSGIIEEQTPLPRKFALHQNYPNPFNPVTTISFDIPQACRVKLELYNSLGQKLQTVINKNMAAGHHLIRFDGSGLASGLYFYKLEAGEFDGIKKMLLVK